jgi:alpha-amylase
MLETIGFDGFRYDMVKGYGFWIIHAIQELRARDDYNFKLYGVGEDWDGVRQIEDWLHETNAWSDNPVAAFDFPLRDLLHQLCDSYGFSLRNLEPKPGILLYDQPDETVTFVENHDVARTDPIINDKMLAYAYILTHDGYPCVFWQDYYNLNLAREGNCNGIAALVQVHEKYAAGATSALYMDDDLYVMQRCGQGSQRGLVLVLNNRSTWNGTRIKTQWINTHLSPEAWCGRDDNSEPMDKWTDESGWTELWAPPRGYAVYVPQ